MLQEGDVPVLGFVAFSGTGKTTLLVKLIPILKEKNLRIGVVKHAHHKFDIDQPGKDSYELRKAGADKMLVASRNRWALMVETSRQDEPGLDEILARMDQRDLDLILIEGFKSDRFAKIEVHRPSTGHPLLFPDDPCIIACATDAPAGMDTRLPILDINDPEMIANFITERIR